MNEFTIVISNERIRQLASKQRKDGKFSTEEAKAFLLLHGQELEDFINTYIQTFVTLKFRS